MILAALLAAWGAAGCAAGTRGPAPTATSPLAVDAVLPVASESGSGTRAWRVFQLGARRYADLPPDTLDGEAGRGWNAREWKVLPSPGGAFRPVQVVQASRGYFLLVDAASSRLCLYDSSAGLISTFPLPESFTPFPAGRAAVFRGVDGTFVFADYASGEAWQYADREAAQGAAAWVLRARVKMPVGWRDCHQPPGEDGLFCRSGSGALRLDGSLNPAARNSGAASNARTLRPEWGADAREWVFIAVSGEGRPLFRFHPASRAITPP